MAIVATSVRQYRRWNSFNLGYSWTLVLRNGSWVTFFIEFYYTCALCNVQIPLHIKSCFHQWCVKVKYVVTVDLQSLFGLNVHTCTHWLRPRNPPPHLGSYTRALLVSQDRRHFFVTPCFPVIAQKYWRKARLSERGLFLPAFSPMFEEITSWAVELGQRKLYSFFILMLSLPLHYIPPSRE